MRTHYASREQDYAPLHFFNWGFSDGVREDVSFYTGHGTQQPDDASEQITCLTCGTNKTRTSIFMDLEVPNGLLSQERINWELRERNFDKIFTIEPEVVKNRNEELGEEKYVYIPLPFPDINLIPEHPDHDKKTCDIFYAGHVFQRLFLYQKIILPIMGSGELSYDPGPLKRFNRLIVSGGNSTHQTPERDVSYQEKLSLNADSRITVGHSIIPIHGRWLGQAKKLSGITTLRELRNSQGDIESNYIVQQKYRNIEAMFCKSLLLHFRDGSRIIEDFFEPDKHFIYFDSVEDFQEKACYILDHYDEYIPMIEDTFEYVMQNHTLEKFFEKYIFSIQGL